LPRKPRNEDSEDMRDDDEITERKSEDKEDDDDDDLDDDDDTIDLDSAEDEEDDDDDEDDDEDDEEAREESVETIERRRLFQAQAEDVLETLTMDDVKEVLKENELDVKLAPKLKKILVEVVNEGEVTTMDEAWEEAVERLED
jgi:hypothetical protein